MAGFMEAINNMFQNGANAVREAALTPQQIEDRANGKRILEMVKLASLVSVAVAVLFAAIFPKVFVFILAGLAAFGAREVHQTCDNILEMLNKATVELTARSSKESLIEQVCQKTFVIGPLLRALDPPGFQNLVLR